MFGRKRIQKFCLDRVDENLEYEDLMNNDDMVITDEKLVNGQGTNPAIFVVVRWIDTTVD